MVLNSLPNFIAETNKVDHKGPWASTSYLQTLTKFTTYSKQAILIVKNVCTFHEGTRLKAKVKRGTHTSTAHWGARGTGTTFEIVRLTSTRWHNHDLTNGTQQRNNLKVMSFVFEFKNA